MKKKIFNKVLCAALSALLFVCVACQNALNAPVSEEKLINVLYDIHTAEALLESESQNMRDSMTKKYYAQIYQKHGISQVDFDSTMAIYTRNPTQLDTVYNRVLRIVKAEKDTLAKH